MDRLKQIWRSTMALPTWVLIWMFMFLVPANIACFWLTDTKIGYWATITNILMFPTNILVLWLNAGLSRALAVPHLFAWIPLGTYVAYRLITGTDVGPIERVYGTALLIINFISLVFDTVDSVKWWQGDREIFGRPEARPFI